MFTSLSPPLSLTLSPTLSPSLFLSLFGEAAATLEEPACKIHRTAGSASAAGSTGAADHAQAVLLQDQHRAYYKCLEHERQIQVYWLHEWFCENSSQITINTNRKLTLSFAVPGDAISRPRPSLFAAEEIARKLIEFLAGRPTNGEVYQYRNCLLRCLTAENMVMSNTKEADNVPLWCDCGGWPEGRHLLRCKSYIELRDLL